MALSERERRVLEQLERDLYEGDASFASRMGASGEKLARAKRRSPKRIVGGAAVAFGGLSLVIFAIMFNLTLVGVAGFAVMVAGLWLATGSFGSKPRTKGGPSAESAKNLFERRWDARESDRG
ncbi:MAG: hypothetical protein RL605_91 [Actinomycetota bacterium]|jgi:hypothetical protein